MTSISLILCIYASQCRIDSEICSKELTAQKLHEMRLQNKDLRSKLDSQEPHSASIRQFREERLKADTRAELAEDQATALRLQLDTLLHDYEDVSKELDTVKEELLVSCKRYVDRTHSPKQVGDN